MRGFRWLPTKSFPISSFTDLLFMQVFLDKINCPVVYANLEVLVMHLGRVAEADNRMSVENLGLIFGQVKNDFIPRF